ncbi:DUF6879 family protein [Streptomyces sp. NPDC091292]|uniref:DUF6879 family protein n=1 Tax=Streptomyces sp. NPDC091292 TaxID=3365991 RepID=UPI003824B0DC
MPLNEPTFADLLARCTRSAVHLEMRDQYAVSDEAEDFALWLSTGERDTDPASENWASWVDLISEAGARGVIVRRARIVSEPVTDYIRWEHSGTVVNIHAGEDVRWLPRRHASGIALPGNDFWLFDDSVIRWNHFTGDGEWAGQRISDDPGEAKLCSEAFATVWAHAISHDEYKIR